MNSLRVCIIQCTYSRLATSNILVTLDLRGEGDQASQRDQAQPREEAVGHEPIRTVQMPSQTVT